MSLPRLLVILDASFDDPVRVAKLATQAGAKLFMWRAKQLCARDYAHTARIIHDITRAHGARLLAHHHTHIALDGVHLPGHALSPHTTRDLLGDAHILGASLHTLDELTAYGDVLSYATFSPIYETPSKPGYGPALGPQGIARAVQTAPNLPIYALGGITPARVADCVEAGAHGVAVMGGIGRASHVLDTTRAYLDALRGCEV